MNAESEDRNDHDYCNKSEVIGLKLDQDYIRMQEDDRGAKSNEILQDDLPVSYDQFELQVKDSIIDVGLRQPRKKERNFNLNSGFVGSVNLSDVNESPKRGQLQLESLSKPLSSRQSN